LVSLVAIRSGILPNGGHTGGITNAGDRQLNRIGSGNLPAINRRRTGSTPRHSSFNRNITPTPDAIFSTQSGNPTCHSPEFRITERMRRSFAGELLHQHTAFDNPGELNGLGVGQITARSSPHQFGLKFILWQRC
jgi:hypothetical protein